MEFTWKNIINHDDLFLFYRSVIGRFENRISVAILFHENSWTDWHEFENLADFEDKKIDASKLDPMIVLNVDPAAVETTARLFVPAVSVKFRHTLWVIPYESYGMSHACRLNLTSI